MPGIQNAAVVANFETLQPDDLSIDQGSFDPQNLSATFPIEPGWIGLFPQNWTVASQTLNGVQVDVDDLDSTATVPAAPPITVTRQRYYQAVKIAIQGGTVNPITINVKLNTQGSGVELLRLSMPNPSSLSLGPFLVAPGQVFRVSTLTTGGSGDTIFISGTGFTSAPGVPIPMVPGVAVQVGI